MTGPRGPGSIGEGPIIVRYAIISTEEDYLNKILQCLRAPKERPFPLKLRDTETDQEFDVVIDRLLSVEHDASKPGTVHFAARDLAGNTVTAFLNHLVNEPCQSVGFANIGLRL